MANDGFRVVTGQPPVVDDDFVRSLFGTDIKGLADKIRRGEFDHIIGGAENEKKVG